MPSYLRFETEDGVSIVLEAEVEEITDGAGPQKAGVKDRVQRTVIATQDAVESAIQQVLRYHGRLFVNAVRSMEEPPAEAEFSFGLKATGELGNFVITKISGEMNYGVRLLWRNEPRGPAGSGG
jgi:hypothetical protein